MLRNRVFYGLLLLAMAVIYIFTNTYYTLTLFGLCVLLPLVSLALMLLSHRGLSISLQAPAAADKGEAVFTYQFENASRLPVARLGFQVQLENQMSGSQKTRKVSTTVGGKKQARARLAIKDSKVGTVIISTKEICIYDAFGLFTLKKTDLPDQATMIYPHMREAAVHMEKAIETTGDGRRYSTDKPGQDVSEVFALREYAPGDEVRKIHWKLSSKIDKMMVRDFSLPFNYSVFLLMELTRGKEDAVDAVVELYLSLSRALLEGGINHNLAWYDAGDRVFHVRELDDFEDLDLAAAQVLASFAGEEKGIALDYYAASAYSGQKNTLVYITSDPDVEKVAEMEVSQAMRTVYVYEDEAYKEQAQQVIELVPVPVNQVGQGIPELMV